jgi:hypothetical protein
MRYFHKLSYLGIMILMGTSLSARAQSGEKASGDEQQSKGDGNRATISVETIASCILHNNTDPEDRIRDIYTWVAKNIAYDPDQIDNPDPYKSPQDLISQVLTKRKAICQGYAALFDTLCKQCSIPSYIVRGYVKHNGIVEDIPHAWNAAKPGDSWLLFDPTWGSGGVENLSFVPRFTLDYFKITPEESIKTRMPYDPIWQLLANPITHQEFISGVKPLQESEKINFNDSISAFLQAGDYERIAIESRRVLAAGIANKQVSDYNKYLLNTLKVIHLNKEADKKNDIVSRSNQAIDYFNLSINAYNVYIRAKNKQFKKPNYTDEQVMAMIKEAENHLINSEMIINNLNSDDPVLQKNIRTLSHNIAELRKSIDRDREFADKYCSTPQNKRLMLFRTPVKQEKSHK